MQFRNSRNFFLSVE